MKSKSIRRITRVPLAFIPGVLLVLWLVSVAGWNWVFEDISADLAPGSQEALASVNSDLETKGDVYLDDDTLIVVDTTANPGESFWLTINMTNTRPLVGWQLKLVYDKDIIYPDSQLIIEPCDTNPAYPCTSSHWAAEYQFAGRASAYSADDWYLVAARIRHKHLDTLRFTAALDVFNLPPLIPVGTGPIVRFKFLVNPDAVPGVVTDIEFDQFWSFEPGETYLANNFADTSADFLIPNTRNGKFTVQTGGPPPNHCPVFALPTQTSFEVNEGTTLQFDVRATDEDGDLINLTMDPLDPDGLSYSFDDAQGVGSVTSTFEYTPGFDEAPATRFVTFRATDEHDCLTTLVVRIDVLETAQDLLMASTLQGGVPGSRERLTPFMITNSVPIYGFQFTFRWDPNKLDVDSIVRTAAIDGFSMYTNLGDSAGKATVLVFGLAGQTIPPGLDTMVYPAFRVHPGAQPGEVDILIENAREAINPGYPSFPLGMINGIFWIDMFGDCNLDRTVDVGDVVALVHYILGELDFGSREAQTADANQDSLVNVGDLVAMIDMILGRWMGPSPPVYPGPMAFIRLDCEELLSGGSGDVKVLADLEVPVAGAQLEINYDPDEVSFQVPRLSERSDHFLIEYRDSGKGKLTLLLYNWSNQPIQVGDGNIISLPAVLSPLADEDVRIELKQAVLADEKAALIPVRDGSPSVPIAFELEQNYPNPFNPSTTIKFTLPSQVGGGSLATTLRIYNVLGQLVRTLVDEPMDAGTHNVIWDGKDEHGSQVASGIYFYKLRSGDYEDTKKMVMMK
jgi:hypothetical protein